MDEVRKGDGVGGGDVERSHDELNLALLGGSDDRCGSIRVGETVEFGDWGSVTRVVDRAAHPYDTGDFGKCLWISTE